MTMMPDTRLRLSHPDSSNKFNNNRADFNSVFGYLRRVISENKSHNIFTSVSHPCLTQRTSILANYRVVDKLI